MEDPQRLLDVETLKQLQASVFPALYASQISRFIQFPSTNTEGIGTNKFYDLGPAAVHGVSSSNITATSPRLVRVGDEHGTTFNGTTQSISLGNSGSADAKDPGDVSFLSTEDWTVILSFSTTQSATDDFGKPLIGRNNADVVAQMIVRNGKFEFARKISSSWEHNLVSTTSVNDGNNHVVAIVNTGSTQTIKLYVDQEEESSGDGSFEAGDYFALDTLMTGGNGVLTSGNLYSVLVLAEAVNASYIEQATSFFTSGGLQANTKPPAVVPPATVSRYENQVFHMQTTNQPIVDVNYIPINSTNHLWFQANIWRRIPIPTGGRFLRLTVKLQNNPGSDADNGLRFYILNTVTFDRGGMVDLTGTTKQAVGIVSCMFQPGEFVVLACQKIGTPNDVGIMDVYSEWLSDIPGEMLILQRSVPDSGGPSNVNATYSYPANSYQLKANPYSAVVDSRYSIVSCPGTLSKVHYWRDSSPGSGKSFTASFYNLDSTQKLSAVLADTNFSASNTVDTLTVAAGQRLTMEWLPSGNSPTSRNGSVSCVYTPDTDSEAPLLGGSALALDTTQTTYNCLWNAGFAAWSTSADERAALFQDLKRLSDFYVHTDVAIPTGETITLTVMRNRTGSWENTSIQVVIDDSGTSFSDLSNSYDIAKNDRLTLKAEPTAGIIAPVKILSWGLKVSDIPASAPQTFAVNYLCRGMTGPTSFGLVAEVFIAGAYRLVVATDSNFSNIVYESGDTNTQTLAFDEADRFLLRFNASGLTAETDYFYAIKVSGVIDMDNVGKARTYPLDNQAPTQQTNRISVISCSKPVEYPPHYQFPLCEHMAKLDILTVVHLGDLLYHDISSDNIGLYRSATQSVLKLPDFQLLLRVTDFVYAKDDHDGGPDDYTLETAGVTHFMPNAVQGGADLVPTKPTDQPEGTSWVKGQTRSWTLGRIKMLLPDLFIDKMSTATPNPLILGDGSVQTITEIGTFTTWNQKQWFLDKLAEAKTNGNIGVFALFTARVAGNGGNGFSSFTSERQWLVRNIVSADSPLVFDFEGDGHRSAAGTESLKDYMVNSSDGIIPWAACSCLRSLGDGGITSSTWNGVNTLTWLRINAANGYQWTASSGNPGVYYAEILGGGDANLGYARSMRYNNSSKVFMEGVPDANKWSYGDYDSLTYPAVYVHLTGDVHPDTQNIDYDYRDLFALIDITDDGSEVLDVAVQHRSQENVPIRGVISRISDQSPVVSMDAATDSVNETAGTIDVLITRTWMGPWRVRVQTSDGTAVAGTDYTAVDVVLDPATNGNNPNSSKATISIPIIDRSGAGTSNRNFNVTLSAPAPTGVTLGATTVTTVSITN